MAAELKDVIRVPFPVDLSGPLKEKEKTKEEVEQAEEFAEDMKRKQEAATGKPAQPSQFDYDWRDVATEVIDKHEAALCGDKEEEVDKAECGCGDSNCSGFAPPEWLYFPSNDTWIRPDDIIAIQKKTQSLGIHLTGGCDLHISNSTEINSILEWVKKQSSLSMGKTGDV